MWKLYYINLKANRAKLELSLERFNIIESERVHEEVLLWEVTQFNLIILHFF